MRPLFASILFACMLSLLACASSSKNASQIDPRRGEPMPLGDIEQQLAIKKIWSRDFGEIDNKKYIKINPYIDADVLYMADSNGKVSAYLASNGKRLWRTRVKHGVTGAVGSGSDKLYLGVSKGSLIALDGRDGSRLWETPLSSEILAPAVEDSGIVVVQTIDGRLYGLDADNGKPRWTFSREEPTLSLRGTATPVIMQGLVLTGFADGTIAAVRLDNGRGLWNLKIAEPRGRNEIERLVDVDISPVIRKAIMYIGSYQGKVVAINMRNGRIIWSRNLSVYTGMAADNQNLYISDDKGDVIALDQGSGSVVWTQQNLRRRQLNAPAEIGGYVVVGDYQGYLHWLDKRDGSLVARNRVSNGAIRSDILVRDKIAYISNNNGDLVAYRIP